MTTEGGGGLGVSLVLQVDDTGAAVPIRTTPSEMGCKQGPTAIQVDNSTAVGIATKEFRQKNSKAVDMRFYWINNRIEQGQFRVF